jgi:ADP-ribose pyrophosphatase
MNNERYIYKGKLLNLKAAEVTLPSGRKTTREVVEHPGAVAIVPLASPDRVILVRQFRYGANRDLLEIPAGTLEPGEDPLSCARRELAEEAGLAGGKLEKMGEFYTSPGILNEIIHLFVATDLKSISAPENGDEDENIEIVELSLTKALNKLNSGEIADAKTIIGLLLVSRVT